MTRRPASCGMLAWRRYDSATRKRRRAPSSWRSTRILRIQLANAMLGMSLFSDQHFDDAATAFNNAGEGVYRDPRMAYAWAFSLVRINDLTKAVEVLNRLNSQPLPTEMAIGVGDLYNQTGDYEDALKVFRKVIQQDASTPRAHYYAGEALIHLDRPNDAISEFQEELKLTPDDPNVQYHLAFAMLQTSQKDDAVKLLQTIVTAHPDHAQAQYQLGKAQLDAGQYEAAIEHLEAAARLVWRQSFFPVVNSNCRPSPARPEQRLHSLPTAVGLSQSRTHRRRRRRAQDLPRHEG